jgi:hypothetical protein
MPKSKTTREKNSAAAIKNAADFVAVQKKNRSCGHPCPMLCLSARSDLKDREIADFFQ